MGVAIVRAEADDTEAFIRLRACTRENAIQAERLAQIGITAATWAADMRANHVLGFVAKQGEALLGYCFGEVDTGEVLVLALLPEAEGQGLGRQLLQRVVQALHIGGHSRLFLSCAANPALRSHGFYRHLGWRPTGEVDAHGDEVLELTLAPPPPPGSAVSRPS